MFSQHLYILELHVHINTATWRCLQRQSRSRLHRSDLLVMTCLVRGLGTSLVQRQDSHWLAFVSPFDPRGGISADRPAYKGWARWGHIWLQFPSTGYSSTAHWRENKLKCHLLSSTWCATNRIMRKDFKSVRFFIMRETQRLALAWNGTTLFHVCQATLSPFPLHWKTLLFCI